MVGVPLRPSPYEVNRAMSYQLEDRKVNRSRPELQAYPEIRRLFDSALADEDVNDTAGPHQPGVLWRATERNTHFLHHSSVPASTQASLYLILPPQS